MFRKVFSVLLHVFLSFVYPAFGHLSFQLWLNTGQLGDLGRAIEKAKVQLKKLGSADRIATFQSLLSDLKMANADTLEQKMEELQTKLNLWKAQISKIKCTVLNYATFDLIDDFMRDYQPMSGTTSTTLWSSWLITNAKEKLTNIS